MPESVNALSCAGVCLPLVHNSHYPHPSPIMLTLSRARDFSFPPFELLRCVMGLSWFKFKHMPRVRDFEEAKETECARKQPRPSVTVGSHASAVTATPPRLKTSCPSSRLEIFAIFPIRGHCGFTQLSTLQLIATGTSKTFN